MSKCFVFVELSVLRENTPHYIVNKIVGGNNPIKWTLFPVEHYEEARHSFIIIIILIN